MMQDIGDNSEVRIRCVLKLPRLDSGTGLIVSQNHKENGYIISLQTNTGRVKDKKTGYSIMAWVINCLRLLAPSDMETKVGIFIRPY